MKKLVTMALALTLIMTMLIPSVALAAPNSKVDLFYDGIAGTPDIDMEGPVHGFVNTNQDDTGNLRVVVKVKDATPLTQYTIWLVGGPTHDTAHGSMVIGYLTTNELGIGNSGEIFIDAATMATASFGDGPHHIDMIGEDSTGFVATPIPYTVP